MAIYLKCHATNYVISTNNSCWSYISPMFTLLVTRGACWGSGLPGVPQTFPDFPGVPAEPSVSIVRQIRAILGNTKDFIFTERLLPTVPGIEPGGMVIIPYAPVRSS